MGLFHGKKWRPKISYYWPFKVPLIRRGDGSDKESRRNFVHRMEDCGAENSSFEF
jgi:hypothetical protein